MNLESASSRADQIARQFLAFGEVPDMATLIARIDAVETSDVTRLAQRLFKGQRPALSAVGQLSRLAEHGKIAAQFA
jgi:predicted Zn-dependent peptidase